MSPRGNPAAEAQIREGLKELRAGNTLAALAHFEKVPEQADDPVRSSCLGYCIAKERGQIKKGTELCRVAIARDPGNPLHTLNLGRIFLLAGQKSEAVAVFREGMSHASHPEIASELERLGLRKPVVFPALRRRHPLNVVVGFLLTKLGLRRG